MVFQEKRENILEGVDERRAYKLIKLACMKLLRALSQEEVLETWYLAKVCGPETACSLKQPDHVKHAIGAFDSFQIHFV